MSVDLADVSIVRHYKHRHDSRAKGKQLCYCETFGKIISLVVFFIGDKSLNNLGRFGKTEYRIVNDERVLCCVVDDASS